MTATTTATKSAAPCAGDSLQPDRSAEALSLRSRALRASAWVIGSRPLGMAIQLARSLILTRLLFPEAFGLMALVGVIMQGLQMCSDVGIGPSIIQSRRGDEPRFLQTAWTLQIIRGVCLWLLCCALAWPAAWFYEEPILRSLLPVCGLTAIIAPFNTTAWFTHDRRMIRGRVTILAYAVQLINLVVMIAAAWWLRSVWALVIGSLSGTLLSVVLGHMYLPGIHHRLCWDRQAVHELVHFGKWIFVSTLLTYFAMQMDKIALGKLVPTELLGIYSIALVLANLPRELIQSISGTVLFPVLAEKFRNDRLRLHHNVHRARGMLLGVGLLLTVGMAAVAPAFFMYLYDPRYHEAGWIAQVLALSVWTTILNNSTGSVLLALGDTKALVTGNFVNLVITTAGCLCGYWWFGLTGFILGYAAGTGAGQLMQGLWLRRYGVGVLRQDALYTMIGLGWAAVIVVLIMTMDAAGYVVAAWQKSAIGLSIWAVVAVALLPKLKAELLPGLAMNRIGRPLQANQTRDLGK